MRLRKSYKLNKKFVTQLKLVIEDVNKYIPSIHSEHEFNSIYPTSTEDFISPWVFL